ncbi:unnamed protein product [Camellia sinensis]
MKKKMGWSHPDIQLEDFLKLIKGFVDILILASGYQSSGSLAHWDPHNFNKAFQWGLFFQNVLRQLRCSDGYQDSVKELDAALSEITSNPLFPQGLAHLSSDTLHRARDFVLEHLIHTLPLRDTHLRDFTIATIEMDLDELWRTRNDFLNVYLNKLVLQNPSVNPDLDRRGFMEDSILSSQDIVPNTKIEGDFTEYTIQELIRRQSAVSCISSAEAGLDILCKAIRQGNWNKSGHGLFEELLKHASAPLLCNAQNKPASLAKSMCPFELSSDDQLWIEEQLIEYDTWNCWKKGTLSYFLDKRTIRLVSGASMIFSAPKVQWVQVFERLNISAEASDDDSLDIIEILSLGCIASRWSSLIEHFMSVSYDSLTMVKQFHEVCSLLSGPQNLHSRMENKNSKRKKHSRAFGYTVGKSTSSVVETVPCASCSCYSILVAAVAFKIGRNIKTVSLLREFGAFTSTMFVAPIEPVAQTLHELLLMRHDYDRRRSDLLSLCTA